MWWCRKSRAHHGWMGGGEELHPGWVGLGKSETLSTRSIYNAGHFTGSFTSPSLVRAWAPSSQIKVPIPCLRLAGCAALSRFLYLAETQSSLWEQNVLNIRMAGVMVTQDKWSVCSLSVRHGSEPTVSTAIQRGRQLLTPSKREETQAQTRYVICPRFPSRQMEQTCFEHGWL
jgi:hypothetical protein